MLPIPNPSNLDQLRGLFYLVTDTGVEFQWAKGGQFSGRLTLETRQTIAKPLGDGVPDQQREIERDLLWRRVRSGWGFGCRGTHAEAWAFTRSGGQVYQLQQTDEEGRQATFAVHLFKLKEQRFLDLYLTKIEGEGLKINAWASISLVPAHLLPKVEQIGPELKLAAMNPDWMQKHLKQNPDDLAHRLVSDGSVVPAASTSELQKFILAH